jgi:transcription elongation factor Elf1
MSKTMSINCPYCGFSNEIARPENYAPRYVDCGDCGKRFIMEPTASGHDVYRDGEAPCCSDPNCMALEMGGGDD